MALMGGQMRDRVTGVVGGGIVGLAVGRELTRRFPDRRVVLYEAEDRLGSQQTGHNSGVVHAGIYYPPGSLKATLCTRGRALLRDYCAQRGLPYLECGKLVVAIEPSELGRLEGLHDTASRNGVPGLRRLDAAGIREIEPHAVGLAGLHSPATAITDYAAVAAAFGEDITAAGGTVRLGTEVTAIRRRPGGIEIGYSHHRARGDQVDEVDEVDEVVVCAGLQADRVSRLGDGLDGPRIVPFRGEYLTVAYGKRHLVRGMIYPVPDPRYPFLGVHLTRRISGDLEIGPNAVLALARNGYRRQDISPRDVRDLLGWPGFWRMARRHWRTGVKELRGSASVVAYLEAVSRYVPEIGPADVRRAGAGLRAQAVDRDGTLVDDFRISHQDGITTVRNAPSPAATSSLAIAEHVVDRMRP